MMKQIRLDKYLTEVKNISRSEAKQSIKKGKVTVNDSIEKKPEKKVNPENDVICFDGEICFYEKFTYLMFHKPQGVVSATEDTREKTVLDCIEYPAKNLFPVGRLDKDTEGLLLLTNDGGLAHSLLSPKKHVDKCYYAVLDGTIGEEQKKRLEEGLDIGDEKPTLPAKLVLAKDNRNSVYITIQEGRYHQVKRMARAVGRKVLYLKRISMGPLTLDAQLKPGQYRPLTQKEIETLKGDVLNR